ncbi:putative CRISPR-associated protein [Dissulfuribacter thermophilus]|uniref:putative CRISPR-associated protein n=1 Tax=Dissulfuribacter thermophilus TaxID=1156395 RepID=UPI0008320EA7|nr:putative CRISPR-associated protein [Dissulfuribacter thermophilus]
MTNKRSFILTTCGTSLLTNCALSAEERYVTLKHGNIKDFDSITDEEDKRLLKALVKRAKQRLAQAKDEELLKMSAELNSLLQYYGGSIPEKSMDVHCLLCSDTLLGRTTGSALKEWLEAKGLAVMMHVQKDLQTVELISFQYALAELARFVHDLVPGYRDKGYSIIFNLTGGFKGVQGFLQTVASFYADEALYIFQTGKELLRIPRLPVRMDGEGIIQEHLEFFRKVSNGLAVEQVPNSLPETMILKMDGEVALSPWGELLWNQCKKAIYRREVLCPPSNLVRFGHRFSQSIKGLGPERTAILNERIDDLSKFMEERKRGGRYNPRRLDFKELMGKPVLESTHECDAWADQDAKRLFCHFEGEVLVVDELGEHL